ncbi:hypothetical protein BOTBODRAFT_36260 [Botryobasidium botryosum FD-172 SS1]|uniref:Uncharacterized protein n=1 Tax=Botryobasidium botryosum (strain FD-172 SS1) TaxID=930990 RepID=A0A067MFN4_BOTB1|nr:hypothetical protein BOTBODRAFT_36260 [Botryobasidium botryosum FD-172 SS1]
MLRARPASALSDSQEHDIALAPCDALAVRMGYAFKEDVYFVIKRHAEGRYHRVSWFLIDWDTRGSLHEIEAYRNVPICLGGPVPYSRSI